MPRGLATRDRIPFRGRARDNVLFDLTAVRLHVRILYQKCHRGKGLMNLTPQGGLALEVNDEPIINSGVSWPQLLSLYPRFKERVDPSRT